MIWVDYLIIGVIFLSGVISLARGVVKEALSLVAWMIAFPRLDRPKFLLAEWFANLIAVPFSLRLAIAFLLLSLATLLFAAAVNYLLIKLVQTTGLTGTDRIFGLFFGIARGAAIITVLVLLAGMTLMPQDPWWQNSRLLNYFQGIALWVRSFMPPDIAGHIQF